MHWSWRPAPEVVDSFDQRVHHPAPEEQGDEGDENQKQDESDVVVLSHSSSSYHVLIPVVSQRVINRPISARAYLAVFVKFDGSPITPCRTSMDQMQASAVGLQNIAQLWARPIGMRSFRTKKQMSAFGNYIWPTSAV